MPVLVKSVTPSAIDIGGAAQEAVITGSGFTTDKLEAVVLDVDGEYIDETILVEQPLTDDVLDNRFPITITVPTGTEDGHRNVVVKGIGEELCDDGTCPPESPTCYVLAGAINLTIPKVPLGSTNSHKGRHRRAE
jgi:hypothetical protein